MIYAVLVLLFRSFFKPATIISALPLAIGGAFMGLVIDPRVLVSIPSLIGLLVFARHPGDELDPPGGIRRSSA